MAQCHYSWPIPPLCLTTVDPTREIPGFSWVNLNETGQLRWLDRLDFLGVFGPMLVEPFDPFLPEGRGRLQRCSLRVNDYRPGHPTVLEVSTVVAAYHERVELPHLKKYVRELTLELVYGCTFVVAIADLSPDTVREPLAHRHVGALDGGSYKRAPSSTSGESTHRNPQRVGTSMRSNAMAMSSKMALVWRVGTATVIQS